MQNKGIKKIVLAYSGGLDTSAIIPWLIPLLLALLIITYVPELSLWLPRVLAN